MGRKGWHNESWVDFKIIQQPNWPDEKKLNEVINKLSEKPALVFAGETRQLMFELSNLETTNSFIIQAGNCAETFTDCNGPKIHNYLRIMLQMSDILKSQTGKNVINIGRIAGQYAKPRSNETEIVDGKNYEVYRGDNVNDFLIENNGRTPNPERLIDGYFHAAATLNLVRAFTQGGYSDIKYQSDWSKHFFHNETKKFSIENKLTSKFNHSIKRDIFYISHEALLLPLEQALTRLDTINSGYFNTSAHTIWIGDRTRFLNSAHIEYARGIENPIGIKVGPKCDLKELIEIIKILNPENEKGKIILIIRLGIEEINFLKEIILSVKNKNLNVIWMSDPMHGNTKSFNKIKYRDFNDILKEFNHFVDICYELDVYVGGIHLEITGEKVTECIGGNQKIEKDQLELNYQTKVDPRLNAMQSAELSFKVGEKLKKIGK